MFFFLWRPCLELFIIIPNNVDFHFFGTMNDSSTMKIIQLYKNHVLMVCGIASKTKLIWDSSGFAKQIVYFLNCLIYSKACGGGPRPFSTFLGDGHHPTLGLQLPSEKCLQWSLFWRETISCQTPREWWLSSSSSCERLQIRSWMRPKPSFDPSAPRGGGKSRTLWHTQRFGS